MIRDGKQSGVTDINNFYFVSTLMKFFIYIFFLSAIFFPGRSQGVIKKYPVPGYELRIKDYIDSLRIVDTHEHLSDPDLLRESNLLDFFLLFHHYNYDDLVSAGMPDSLFNPLFIEPLTPKEKWKLIEP